MYPQQAAKGTGGILDVSELGPEGDELIIILALDDLDLVLSVLF